MRQWAAEKSAKGELGVAGVFRGVAGLGTPAMVLFLFSGALLLVSVLTSTYTCVSIQIYMPGYKYMLLRGYSVTTSLQPTC